MYVIDLQEILSKSNLRARLEKLMRPGGKWERDVQRYRELDLTASKGYRLQDQDFYRDVHKIHMDEKRKALLQLKTLNPELWSRIKLRNYQKVRGQQGDFEDIQRLLALPK